MFKTIAHQTLQFRRNNPEVEANGPFPVDDVKKSFLGAGYYFWDNHFDLAHWWGQKHCKPKYIICECEIGVPRTELFDLIGSREDQIHMSSIINKLNLHHLSIGEVIEYLKDLEIKTKGIFPYKAIRAADNSHKKDFFQEQFLFNNGKPSFAILAPMYIICLLEKNNLILSPFKIVFSP